MIDPPFTPKSLGERWACSADHVRKLCRSGTLRSFRLGRDYRIPVSVVEEFEAGGGTAAPAPVTPEPESPRLVVVGVGGILRVPRSKRL